MSKYKHTNESEKRGRFIRFRGNNARPPGVRILNVPWKSVIYQLNVNVCLCIQHKAKKIESIRNGGQSQTHQSTSARATHTYTYIACVYVLILLMTLLPGRSLLQ